MDMKQAGDGAQRQPVPPPPGLPATASDAPDPSALAYSKSLPDPDRVFVVDFFAGCGGMSSGFASTRQSHLAYRVLAGLDIDAHALRTYAANVPGSEPVLTDIFGVAERPEKLRRLIPGFDVDACRPLVFIGCAPCQGFSAHRKKDDRDDVRNSLMAAFARICAAYRPDAVVMENVPEIITGRFSGYYDVAERILVGAGYKLSSAILDLSLYGVPQRRRRAIVLGGLAAEIPIPAPVFTADTAPTVRQAIAHLAPIEAGRSDPDDPMHRAPRHTERILDRIRKTPPDGGDRRALAAVDQLDCHARLDGRPTPGFTDVYGRLRWDRPSVTITAKSSTPSCGRFLHPEQHRNISVREAAILQGFPQHYRFLGPFVNRYRQIGEAVPPLFARHLARAVLDHLRPAPAVLAATERVRAVSSRPAPAADAFAIVDGFCGAGGIGLGFAADGWRNAFAFDINADAVRTFARNVSSRVEVGDVASDELHLRIDAALAGDDFVIAGGPPCQGFSQQRRGTADDPRNNLVLRYADLVAQLSRRPLAVILENVTYLDSPRGRDILGRYRRRMAELGYTVFRHDLNSAQFEAPQLRKRIILVAVARAYAGAYRGPAPLTADRWRTVGEALAGLSPGPDADRPAPANHVPSREGALNKRRIAFVDMGMGRLAIPARLQLACHRKYGGHLDVYGRLDWFSQARTITGGFDSFTRGEFAHPFLHRSITHREAARIQGFPDWFVFEGNRAAVRRQIGNAVPPPMAYAIARAIRRAVQRQRGA